MLNPIPNQLPATSFLISPPLTLEAELTSLQDLIIYLLHCLPSIPMSLLRNSSSKNIKLLSLTPAAPTQILFTATLSPTTFPTPPLLTITVTFPLPLNAISPHYHFHCCPPHSNSLFLLTYNSSSNILSISSSPSSPTPITLLPIPPSLSPTLHTLTFLLTT